MSGLRVLPAIVILCGIAAASALLWMLIAPGLLAPEVPGYDAARMRLVHSTLPRLATALIAGFALSLAGALLQQVLRNPLASPTTLGVSAGAHLALAGAMLFFPALLGLGRDAVALLGAGLAAALVMALGARRGFSPLTLVLSGLVIGLWCGALAAALVYLNDRRMVSLFIWGAGSLATQSWEAPLALLWKTGLLTLACGFLLRPLTLLELGDEEASALGLKLARTRFLALALAVGLSALVTSAVGVIGFIGLVAPILARLLGARRIPAFLLASGLIGAALLLTTDALLQLIAGIFSDLLPTGAVTAVFGSPLLLLLLPRLKIRREPFALASFAPRRRGDLGPGFALVAAALAGLVVLALFLGRDSGGGWSFDAQMLSLRAPRVFTALAAGAMLAVSGLLLQRLTGNEMASPEVLGVSSGATLGLALGVFLVATPGFAAQLGFAGMGAFAVLAAILISTRRSALAPERVLLVGIALSALVDALVGLMAATGDPRALTILRWMSGSTYGAEAGSAALLCAGALILILPALLARRWLDLLPLGPETASALGIPVRAARLRLFALAGALSAAATLGVGPLSFVGLMAPHLARELGFSRAASQTAGAALIGALLMVAADWIGRTAVFPWQIPAGLVAALTGAPFLILLLFRRGRT
ncbi:Fe(3+)-hydroxamate ABC transporter permease FhuB [Neomegalonema sp.]|uniref:Fe(3+)-hydroxamate ABC transporter permease FhuB n=1 Tax=Neomegalonema sp. TaxID=2039713 RepID=UPI002625E895|nr:Fe(3+)-hydroxamate ABC transporter permease FhuB [Neomegalonema sp.]MDD2867815.1 Fe(3+)-hydroxamate ABC transporter permease FhuB [Neomegalonema sp.]